jgi:hypothetical protein
MPIKYRNAGFISATYQPLQVANAPTIGTATGGDTQASVTFTAPSNVGGSAITAYYAVSNPGQITASAASSPITVTGLTNGTAYTFTVWALNSYGPSPYSGASGSVTPALPQRGLIAGGLSPSSNVIEYIEIPTLSNSTDFGDLTLTVYDASSMSNATRAVFAGGASSNNVMGYVTIASVGNATDFGDLTGNRRQMSQGSVNSTTRGIVAGGWDGSAVSAQIQYITIATTGNATNFGDLTNGSTHGYWPGSFSSSTRGIFGGGGGDATIDYVTIASTGNATNFGNLTVGRDGLSGCSNATRGLFAQGYDGATFLNTIDYVTIASTGNATDFGDCSTASRGSSSMSNATRAVINAGASSYPYSSNIMEYVTIASTGNTTDFGDLTVSLGERTACSAANGGTQ